jgi:hypothetical protein
VVLRDARLSRIDAISFGPQVTGFTLGRVGSSGGWNLTVPTPAASNTQAALAPTVNIRINEWLANALPAEDDWLEVFNPDPERPAALKDLAFEVDGALFQIASLSFVPPSGFLALLADERAGPDHVGFRLAASGASMTLLDADGTQIDRVAYSVQAEGLSEGRLADGGEEIGPLPQGPTPGSSNASTPPGSALRISRVHFLPAGTALEFPAAANRSYSVLYTDDLGNDGWSKLADVEASPTSRLETVIDPAFGNTARFYKVVTPSQP